MTQGDKENNKNISTTEYVLTNFQRSDRLAVLVRNRSRGETVQRITTSAKIADPSFQDWLRYKNEKESCDIYIGMNTLKPEARTRTKDDIQTIRHLYMDIDHDGPAALAKIQQSNLVPPRNYTISTSPDKFQVVWRVENISQEQAESLAAGHGPQVRGRSRGNRLDPRIAPSGLPEPEIRRGVSCARGKAYRPCLPSPRLPAPNRAHRNRLQATPPGADIGLDWATPNEPVGTRLGLCETRPRQG